MAEQDAQDINQMMSATADVAVSAPKKSKFLWIVLGCIVVGVGLGVAVYQQSLKSSVKPTITPRPTVTTVKPSPAAVASPIASPVLPGTNEVTPAANTITFSKAGKIRVYSNLNNAALVIKVTVAGVAKTLTLPSRAVNSTTLMNFSDSTFDVAAGSTATIEVNYGSATGPKMRGWMSPTDLKTCGANGATTVNQTPQLSYVQSKLGGESIYSYQCWEDDDTPGEFNDFYLLWTYVPPTTTSPSPSSSTAASSSPTASKSPSPSPSASAKASASPSVKASASVTPTPSPRVSMPDTTDGTPVTGIFEVTVGTISVGLILVVLGLLSLLAL
jgi:hypothetical protein